VSEPSEEPGHEGLSQLQAAAIEVIGAARAFLDTAEQLVRDPSTSASVLASMAELGRSVVSRATGKGGAGPVE
jgi:hypothetical protein